MANEERSAWLQALVALVGWGIYAVMLRGRLDFSDVSAVSYGWLLAGTVIGMIVANIVLAIASAVYGAIVQKDHIQKADERDVQIGRWGEYIGVFPLAAGSAFAMIMAVLEVNQFWIANALFLGFVVSSVTASTVKIVAYRRGY